MKQYTKEELLEKYNALPSDLRSAITNTETRDIIQSVAKKYGLNIEQAGNLADEVGLLMLGETHPRDFTANLAKRLGADPETTKKIAAEINDQIFSKVRESLKKIHGVGEEIPAPSPQPPAPSPQSRVSPFEEKLQTPEPTLPAKTEIEQARKENRYPQSADPYKEPPSSEDFGKSKPPSSGKQETKQQNKNHETI